MLRNPAPHQHRLEMVTLEELVPQDHLLRKIDRHIDFGFIHEAVKPLYCEDKGRPALDPTVLFKMLLIGYLFGIRSERQLVKKIQVNVAYRWFLGLSLTDKMVNASTFSQNRRRRYEGSGIEQLIFDQIVEQAFKAGLITGKAPSIPATASLRTVMSLPAMLHDSRPYLSRLDRQPERFGLSPEVVGLDAGYQTAAICQGLE